MCVGLCNQWHHMVPRGPGESIKLHTPTDLLVCSTNVKFLDMMIYDSIYASYIYYSHFQIRSYKTLHQFLLYISPHSTSLLWFSIFICSKYRYLLYISLAFPLVHKCLCCKPMHVSEINTILLSMHEIVCA